MPIKLNEAITGDVTTVNVLKNTTAVQSWGIGWKFRRKANIIKGDFKTPLPYFHESFVQSIKSSTKSYYRNRYYENNRYVYRVELIQSSGAAPISWLPYSDSTVRLNNSHYNDTSCIVSSDFNRSDKKALEQLAQEKAQLGAMVAELSETVSYFARYAYDLFLFYRAVKFGDGWRALEKLGVSRRLFKDTNKKISKKFTRSEIARNSANIAAARFLEWKFAILPVVSDIRTLNQLAIKQLTDLKLDTFSVRGKYKRSMSDPQRKLINGFHWEHEPSVEIIEITKLLCKIDDLEVTIQKAVGLDNFATPAWELVPYSWLIDYAVDIGDTLKAHYAKKGVSLVNGYNSRYYYGTIISTTTSDSSNGGTVQGNKVKMEVKTHVNAYKRSLITRLPNVRPSWKLHEIKVGQAANALALLTAIVTGNQKKAAGFSKF